MPLAIPFVLAVEAHLVDGEPRNADCLDTPSCADAYTRSLAERMTEAGFAYQHDALLTSSALDPMPGFVAGVMTTWPGAPRVVGGWRTGDGGVVTGTGGFFLPPLTLGDTSALVGGIDLSVSRPFGHARLGLEGDFTYTRAEGPRDTLQVTNFAFRTAGAVPAGPVIAWGKLGLAYVNERLTLHDDETAWSLWGVQPSAHAGVGVPIGIVYVAGGGAIGYQPAIWDDKDRPGAYVKLEAAAGVRF